TVVLGCRLAFQVADSAGEIRNQNGALDARVAHRRLAADGRQVIAAILVEVDGHGPAARHGASRAAEKEYRQASRRRASSDSVSGGVASSDVARGCQGAHPLARAQVGNDPQQVVTLLQGVGIAEAARDSHAPTVEGEDIEPGLVEVEKDLAP